MSLRSKFTEHPASVDETYGQHFVAAMGFSQSLVRAAFYCAVHAVFPWIFVKTGSACIAELNERMVANRRRVDGAESRDLETNGA